MLVPIEEIKAFVDRNKFEMLLFWETLVNMQAGSHETEKVNRILEFLRKHYDAEGIPCRIVANEGGPNVLVVEYGKELPGKPLLFAGHCDTVFPEGSYPPNPFHIKDGIAYGPGVVDMKMGIAQIFYIFLALKQFGYKDRPVKAILVGDEEISHYPGHADKIIMEEAKGALCCFNMETGRMDNRLTVGRKGGMDCHITVHGKAGHAGNDYTEGRNAIIEMCHKLPLLQGLADVEEGLTVSADLIKGGTVSNSIPDTCTAVLDVRYSQLKHMDYIQKKITEVCQQTFIAGTTTKVEFVAPMPAFEETEANHQLLGYINSVTTKYGYPAFGSVYVGGMSDAAYISSVGVPTVCSMGGQGSGGHTLQEQASVESFLTRTVIVLACALEVNAYEQKASLS